MTPSEQSDSQYLVFHRVQPPDRKTPVVHVHSKSSGVRLGMIGWFGRWRQFCFWPSPETVFNTGCMTAIQAKITELAEERRS